MEQSDFVAAALAQMLHPENLSKVTGRTIAATDGILQTYENVAVDWARIHGQAAERDRTVPRFRFPPYWDRTSRPTSILAFWDRRERVRLAGDPDTPPEWLQLLARDGELRVRNQVAQNLNTPADTRSKLLSDSDSRITRMVEVAEGPMTLGRTNSANAMHSVAQEYDFRGEFKEAVHWYTKAAENGHVGAMHDLGAAYLDRDDRNLAIGWFTKAAEAGGDATDMFVVGALNEKQGNPEQAIRWFTRAAEAGHVSSMLGLTEIYSQRGDRSREVVWLRKAADAGDENARTILQWYASQETTSAQQSETAVGPVAGQKQGGCYIATAVYGSYDAPPVVTLRRLRDERLARSVCGRAFIRFYYAVSPPLAKYFEQATRLNGVSRLLLDAAVQRIDEVDREEVARNVKRR
ncbi:tetratricopeptide repeat protein [Nocardioides bigeumensis]|uniref:Sel1 repeat family protein n=1 Tax=Nocardioides bigeumensis TaxID=433657 RepID=A0ABP5KKB7_9ACTN